MNTSKIRHAAEEIDRYQLALSWLSEHGVKINRDSDEQVTFRPNFAGSCSGSKEAAEVIGAMMTNRLSDLIKDAITNCENTIEIHRQTIRDEATPPPTTPNRRERCNAGSSWPPGLDGLFGERWKGCPPTKEGCRGTVPDPTATVLVYPIGNGRHRLPLVHRRPNSFTMQQDLGAVLRCSVNWLPRVGARVLNSGIFARPRLIRQIFNEPAVPMIFAVAQMLIGVSMMVSTIRRDQRAHGWELVARTDQATLDFRQSPL